MAINCFLYVTISSEVFFVIFLEVSGKNGAVAEAVPRNNTQRNPASHSLETHASIGVVTGVAVFVLKLKLI